METLGIRDKIFPEVLKPGTKIGNYQKIPVILPACHDTASAVVSVPSNTRDSAFLSSGTWSLLGIELDELILNDQALEANLTNEEVTEGPTVSCKTSLDCGLYSNR